MTARNKALKPTLGFVPEPLQLRLVVAPVFVDLDEQFQENLLPRKLLDVGAGLHAKFLDGAATLADDDGFLRVAGHIDDAADVDAVFGLLITFHLDLHGIRDLLLEPPPRLQHRQQREEPSRSFSARCNR